MPIDRGLVIADCFLSANAHPAALPMARWVAVDAIETGEIEAGEIKTSE